MIKGSDGIHKEVPPGNLPSVITVANAIKQLFSPGIKATEIAADNGYYSEQNHSRLFQAGFDFIALVKTDLKWVRQKIDRHMEELKSISSVYPLDTYTRAIYVILMHDFTKAYKYANHKNGRQKGFTEAFGRRIYLNIYFNCAQ